MSMHQCKFDFGDRVNIDGDKSIVAVVVGIFFYPCGMKVDVAWFAHGKSEREIFEEFRLSGAE